METIKVLQAPVVDTALLTTREKIILLQGSKLNGCKFPPWESVPPATEFQGALFEDDTPFRFSKLQQEAFNEWRRSGPSEDGRDGGPSTPIDLVQDMTSDCSLVASLCADIARTEKFPTAGSIIRSTLFPRPENPPANGKYMFKMNFNGCLRQVVIDNRLPVSQSEQELHVCDRNGSSTSWPALAEKAYLKVRGGYNFPGSNSGTDLWVLSGWIPEQLFLQSDELVPRAFWKRVSEAFNYGDVMMTIGTGKLTPSAEVALRLIGEHNYAVVNLKETGDEKFFLIKNPWSKGTVWKGRRDIPEGNQPEEETGNAALLPGTFWMDLNALFHHFETVYLNWNPGLFKYRKDHHFSWDLRKQNTVNSFARNPQYIVRSEYSGSLWILLSRHFGDIIQEKDDTGWKVQQSSSGFLSLYAYEGAHRLVVRNRCLIRSPYVDAPNVLLRFELRAATSYIIIASEQNSPFENSSFTLSAWTLQPLKLFEAAPVELPYAQLRDGAWTHSTAGGNASNPAYSTNPQYSFLLPETSRLSILLEVLLDSPNTAENLAVNVKIIWAQGKRIPSRIVTRDVLGDSGEYRPGSAFAEIPQAPAGTYTIVCSTFNAGQLAPFRLQINSKVDGCVLKPVPLEDAGLFVKALPPAIFSTGQERILAPVIASRITRLRIRASIPQLSMVHQSPIKLSLELGQGPSKQVLLTSGRGEFVYATHGLRTEDIDVQPAMCNNGGLWLVLERIGGAGAHAGETVHIEVLCSDSTVKVGAWGREVDDRIEEVQKRMADSSIR